MNTNYIIILVLIIGLVAFKQLKTDQPKISPMEAIKYLDDQEPDVIMVGEVRDEETVDLAIRAALTGHLVFSTVHTNDAASAYTRLLDLGVEEFLLNAALVSIVAQRLARKICNQCEQPHPDAEKLIEKYYQY